MTKQALIYHRPSKWPIAAALGTAVLIHLSAVAIAFHRESPATEPAGADYPDPFVDIESADDPPIPPDPDISLPPPPPQKKIQQKAQPIKAPQVATAKPPGMMSASQGKANAISAPRPDYPYEARSRHITGSGVCVVTVDTGSGNVTDATMAQSIGNPILDNSAVSAFKRWRFKPGSVSKVKIPITFTMTGASY